MESTVLCTSCDHTSMRASVCVSVSVREWEREREREESSQLLAQRHGIRSWVWNISLSISYFVDIKQKKRCTQLTPFLNEEWAWVKEESFGGCDISQLNSLHFLHYFSGIYLFFLNFNFLLLFHFCCEELVFLFIQLTWSISFVFEYLLHFNACKSLSIMFWSFYLHQSKMG